MLAERLLGVGSAGASAASAAALAFGIHKSRQTV